MTCDELLDRMPDVVAGRDTWTDTEHAHLRSCAECAASWQITRAATAVGATTRVDPVAIAAAVSARLATRPGKPRISWRRVAWPVAIAASLAAVAFAGMARMAPAPDADIATVMKAPLFPELEPLSEPELRLLLADVQVTDSVVAGSSAEIPRLGDLTDAQLEQLLLSVETE